MVKKIQSRDEVNASAGVKYVDGYFPVEFENVASLRCIHVQEVAV